MTVVESSFEKARRKMVAARIEFMSQLARFSQAELAIVPEEEGAWSPLQMANHVYIAEGLALEQMRLVQTQDNPLVMNIGMVAPRLTNESEIPVSLEAVLAGMAARREEIYEFLSELPAEAWERPFCHEEWGERKFYQLVNVLPYHDQQHARQLAAMKG